MFDRKLDFSELPHKMSPNGESANFGAGPNWLNGLYFQAKSSSSSFSVAFVYEDMAGWIQVDLNADGTLAIWQKTGSEEYQLFHHDLSTMSHFNNIASSLNLSEKIVSN